MEKALFRGARQLAAYTGLSMNAIHILMSRNGLPVHRQGRSLVFVKSEIDEFFARLPGTTLEEALQAATERANQQERRVKEQSMDGQTAADKKEDKRC